MNRFAWALLAGIAFAPTAFAQLEGGAAAVVVGNNRFAWDLYGRLAAKPGNLFLSPYSISTALAMTSAGAAGETRQQMDTTLHFGLSEDKLHPAFRNLIDATSGPTRKRAYKLSVANSLWGQKGFEFQPDFLNVTRANYGAGLQEVDFVKATEAARQRINAWVEKETAGKITDLIPAGVLDEEARLVLTNAIYFKASWMGAFEKGNTQPADFTLSGGSKVRVPLMHRNDGMAYFEEGGLQAVEIPYEHRDLSMIVILPKSADGLRQIENTLKPEELDRITKGMKQHQVDLKLPKFKVTAQFKLKEVLSAMGMPLAFSDRADFSKMVVRSTDALKIGEVIHKAFIDVDEKGTEAAAATAVIMVRVTSALPQQLPRATFHADRPFAFVLKDNRTGSILFMGRLADPR
ncbi:MAG: serpin family protein [Gemmataceae bacterium]